MVPYMPSGTGFPARALPITVSVLRTGISTLPAQTHSSIIPSVAAAKNR